MQVPKNFTIDEVPFRPGVAPPDVADDAPDLGPLKAFTGTFTGRGFNTIFRPHKPSIPIGLDIEPPPSDNVLELNLTIETLSFHDKLGKVPNRGLLQADIELNGVPYLQSISDVTDPTITTPIHFEPGLWLIVPPTEHPDARESTFARLASIPHGTTINAQGTMVTIAGPPEIEPVDITPFSITDPTVLHTFASQTVSDVTTARIPKTCRLLRRSPRNCSITRTCCCVSILTG